MSFIPISEHQIIDFSKVHNVEITMGLTISDYNVIIHYDFEDPSTKKFAKIFICTNVPIEKAKTHFKALLNILKEHKMIKD